MRRQTHAAPILAAIFIVLPLGAATAGCETATYSTPAPQATGCTTWDWVINTCNSNPPQGVCIAQEVYFKDVCTGTLSYSACLKAFGHYSAAQCVTAACIYYDLTEPPDDKLCI